MFFGTLLLLLLVSVALVGCQATRSGYESAPYQVVHAAHPYEVRDYPALTVVETPLGPAGEGSGGGFNRLFKYITGRNDTGAKISMTTPVFMSGGASNATMAFVLPAKLPTPGAPAPLDPNLKLRELPASRYAVYRFTGGRNAAHEAEAVARLQTWMAAEQLPVLAAPVYGYFDPPWTPTFLRRNEVMLATPALKP